MNRLMWVEKRGVYPGVQQRSQRSLRIRLEEA